MKEDENINKEENSEIRKSETTNTKTLKNEIRKNDLQFSGISIFTKGLILLALFLGFNILKSQFAGKNPMLEHFKNDLAEGQTFDLTFLLQDIKTGTSQVVNKQRQIVYSSNSTLSAANFTLDINREQFQKDPTRYRLETQVTYNSKKLGHAKSVNCYAQIAEVLETKIRTSGYYDPVAKTKTQAAQPHIFSKLYVHLIFDTSEYDFSEDEVTNYLYQQTAKNRTEKSAEIDYYFPHLDCANYWTLRRDKIPVSVYGNNETIPIEVCFRSVGITKFHWIFKLYIAENQANSIFNDSQAMEEFKVILSDNGFYYLVLLFSVNFLHSLFSFLSIKNNISFYRSVKSKAGISMRKHYTDIVFQFVIVLYLIENETSMMVIALTIVEGVISVWIALRMTKFEKRLDGKFPYYQLEESKNTAECQTEMYDRQATGFLSKIFLPLLGVYYVYSFWTSVNLEYYPFVLKNLVAFIHAVGFINMTPQIFINYKLKSVDFMPWKGMVYQFLNTIIDDLFAFAVKMPTLQRISVFRDDLIFVIYLGQKWIYRENVRKGEEEEKIKTD